MRSDLTLKRRRGRPPGTKDPERKTIELWLAVELQCQQHQCSANEAAKRVAGVLRARGHDLNHKHIDKVHRQAERRRQADPAFAEMLGEWRHFGESMLRLGEFVPNASRSKRYETAWGKFFPKGEPLIRRWRERSYAILLRLSRLPFRN